MDKYELDNIPYSDIDLNLCWICNESNSDMENYIFKTLSTCDKIPTAIIKNENGKYELQFRKEGSIIKLNQKKLWYNKTDLTAILKLLE